MAEIATELTVNFQGTASGFSVQGFGMFYLSPSDNIGTLIVEEGQTYTANVNTGGKLYNVVGVAGCTISNINRTERTFDVVFTSDTATIRVYADNPSSIIGAYTLNQTLNKLGDVGQQYDISVSFTSDDEDRSGLQFVNGSGGWHVRYLGGAHPPVAYNQNTGWASQSYRLVDFGDAAQEVPAMFKDWVEENGSAIFTITKEATNASITASSTAKKGSNVQFTVTPNAGYTVTSVLVVPLSGVSNVPTIDLGNGRYTFTMPGSDVEIRVTATVSSTNCTVTFDSGVLGVDTAAGSGGSWRVSGTAVNISGISTSGRYTFSVSLADGYTLSNVTGTGCTILSKAATSFVVGFSSTTSRIAVVTEKEGVENYPIDWKYSNATLTGAVSSAEAGSPVSFSVLPANGYKVTGVTASANEAPLQVNVSGSTYYFIMPSAAVTVTVLTELAPQNTDLRVNFDSGVGYVSANINGGSYAFSDTGDSKEISYIPGAENAFTAALVNGYRISYVNGENCTISDINYAEGTFSVVFTGTPSTVNIGTQALEPETVEVSLAVMFDAGVSAVRTNVDGTTVSWTTSGGRQTFETQDGATRDFSISLVSGYYLDSVSGTGCTITAQTENEFSVLFTSTTPNVSIVTQRAAQISYPISYSYTSGTLNGPSSAEEGETVTFTFTPENGYTVGNVTVMGNTEIDVENSGNSYSFTMPAEPVAVSITVNTPDIITIQTLGVFKEEADKAYAPFDVVYAPAALTDEQQAQARENIGAVSETELSQALEPYALQDGTYAELSAGHATEADRATGDENGNRIISFYGHDLMLSINPQTYVMTITLVSEDGTVLATRSIDLPLESMVVSGTYDEATKEVVLTLQSGQQVRFSVADLVDGLASQAALDTETQARETADAALAQEISALQDGTTPAGVASKLATEDVGSAAKPVYFENGVPVACGDNLAVDITGTAANADNLGGTPAKDYALKEDVNPFGYTEFGVRWIMGSSAPSVERVIRRGGVIEPWDVDFYPNVGKDNAYNSDFDNISIFSPVIFYDRLGNKFSRFKKFYKATQIIGMYYYIWFCERRVYSFYSVPLCFKRADGTEFNFLDIGCYEGAEENHQDSGETDYTCLVSKPGKIPAHSRDCTTFYNYAKNNGTVLGIDTTQEEYRITTMSEITEVLQPMILLAVSSRNAQNTTTGYNGNINRGLNGDTGRTILAYDRDDDGNATNVIYTEYNTTDLNAMHGYSCISIDKNQSATNASYYRVTNGEVVTGSIAGGIFTAADSGTDYIKITLDRTVTQTITVGSTTIWQTPHITGETDTINATHGTLSQNGYHSFKIFNIENPYGNIDKSILDVRIKDYVPYVCRDLSVLVETPNLDTTPAWEACNYQVSQNIGYATEIGYDTEYPDVQLTTAVGGSTTTHYCDFCWVINGSRDVHFGGNLTDRASCGCFAWVLNHAVGATSWFLGSRLSHLAM